MAATDLKYTVSAENRFSAVFSALNRDISATAAGVQRLRAFAGTGLQLVSLGSAATLGGAAVAVRQLTRDLDALNDASDATGDSIENLSALEDVARRNGESLETVVSTVVRLNKTLQEARPGSGVSLVLQRIGLDAAELRRLAPTEALQRLAVALQGYENNADKARLVQELFGKSLREVAPLLKDVADAGDLNATVTTRQAEQAERFNKQLAALSTNASNAARSLVGDLLPALNRLLESLSQTGVSGAIAATLGLDERAQLESRLTDINARATRAADTVARLSEQLSRDPADAFLAERVEKSRQRLAALQREASGYSEALKALANRVDPFNAGDRAREDRGFVPSLPTVGDTSSLGATTGNRAPAKPDVSDAERYLQTLERQLEALQANSVEEQTLRDLSLERIKAVTPAERERLLNAARAVDALKQVNLQTEAETKRWKELDDAAARSLDQVLARLDRQPAARIAQLQRERELLERRRASISDDNLSEADVSAFREALREINDEIETLRTGGVKAFDALQVRIDDFAKRSVDAITEFVVEGKGSFSDLFRSFAKDVLRAQIEDPVRDAMKSVVNIIRTELKKVGEGSNPLAGVLQWLQGAFGGGGGLGNLLGSIGSVFGFTSRSLGGGVRAGQLVSWQENGREWFSPGSDGQVLTQRQMAAAQASAPVGDTYHLHINGPVSPQTVALVQRLIEQAQARQLRAQRLGPIGAAA